MHIYIYTTYVHRLLYIVIQMVVKTQCSIICAVPYWRSKTLIQTPILYINNKANNKPPFLFTSAKEFLTISSGGSHRSTNETNIKQSKPSSYTNKEYNTNIAGFAYMGRIG